MYKVFESKDTPMEEPKLVPTIGIIGYGYVGRAIEAGFSDHIKTVVYDKYLDVGVSLKEMLTEAAIVFVAVPSPMDSKTGACDTSIVIDVVKEAATISTKHDLGHKIFVIKTTVPPGTCEKLASLKALKTEHTVMFNPEFLTEQNCIKDFLSQTYTILGRTFTTNDQAIQLVADLYATAFTKLDICCVESKEAEMLKYITNGFLATKLMFFNEIYKVCEAAGINYELCANMSKLDKRIGYTHMQVPGADAQFGFGGKCFPKDIRALQAIAKKVKIDIPVVDAVWKENVEIRDDHDWEHIVGATTDNPFGKKEKPKKTSRKKPISKKSKKAV